MNIEYEPKLDVERAPITLGFVSGTPNHYISLVACAQHATDMKELDTSTQATDTHTGMTHIDRPSKLLTV